jgi:hypothetical protein
MPFTLVQTAPAPIHTGFVNNATIAFSSNVTAGNFLHMWVATGGAGIASGGSITDTRSNTWVNAFEHAFGGVTVGLWYVVSANAGSTTVTIDPAGGGDLITATMREYAGQDVSAILAGTANGTHATGTTINSPSLTPTSADVLITAVMAHFAGSSPSITEGGGFTLVQEDENGTGGVAISAVQRIVSSVAAYQATWAVGSSVTGLSAIAAFKAYVAPPPTNVYRHARAGTCEAGTCISGLVPYQLTFKVAGVDRTFLVTSFSITHTSGQPSTMTFRCHGWIPQQFQEVQVTDDNGLHLLFGGTIINRTRNVSKSLTGFYTVQCVDWSFLINKTNKVYTRFENLSSNMAIRKILGFIDPAVGIVPGNIPNFGSVSLTHVGESVTDALKRVCDSVHAQYRITPWKSIDVFQTEPPNGNIIQIRSGAEIRNLTIQDMGSQIRNRVQYEGIGAQTTALVPANATTIPLAEMGQFNSAGGQAIWNWLIFSYTGKTASSGPGSLTGVTWPNGTYDIPLGDPVNVFVQQDDATRQSALAALFGGGISGVSVYYASDERVGESEASGRNQQNINYYGDAINQIDFGFDEYTLRGGREFESGRLVDFDLTDGDGVRTVGNFRITAVTISQLGDAKMSPNEYGVSSPLLYRAVTLRPGVRQGAIDFIVGG